jgi:hypothetical protein
MSLGKIEESLMLGMNDQKHKDEREMVSWSINLDLYKLRKETSSYTRLR